MDHGMDRRLTLPRAPAHDASSLIFAVNALFSSQKFCKIFQILCHIESLDVCMEY